MFPVRRCVLFQIQPHAKRAWKRSKPFSEDARKLHFFESNLSRSPHPLFSMPQPFQNQSDWLPTSHGWCPHLHEKFFDSTAPGPKVQQNTCQDDEVMCWNPNREILQPPRPYCEPLNFVWIVITRCRCMSMRQPIVHVCSHVENLGKHNMLKTFHLDTVESSGITKLTGMCNVDATNCSYIVQTRPKYSGWFHVSNTATTRPMRFKLHSKMFSKSALPVVHFSSKIRCWLFTKKHIKKNLVLRRPKIRKKANKTINLISREWRVKTIKHSLERTFLKSSKLLSRNTSAGTANEFAWNISKALLTCIKWYCQVQDMKWLCSLRSSRSIQSTKAQPGLPSLGQRMSAPKGSKGSGDSQKAVFISMKVGSPENHWKSIKKSATDSLEIETHSVNFQDVSFYLKSVRFQNTHLTLLSIKGVHVI